MNYWAAITFEGLVICNNSPVNDNQKRNILVLLREFITCVLHEHMYYVNVNVNEHNHFKVKICFKSFFFFLLWVLEWLISKVLINEIKSEKQCNDTLSRWLQFSTTKQALVFIKKSSNFSKNIYILRPKNVFTNKSFKYFKNVSFFSLTK